ncbi:MAG: hypothetical protein ACOC7S_00765 [Planctomycetota bacterium]
MAARVQISSTRVRGTDIFVRKLREKLSDGSYAYYVDAGVCTAAAETGVTLQVDGKLAAYELERVLIEHLVDEPQHWHRRL